MFSYGSSPTVMRVILKAEIRFDQRMQTLVSHVALYIITLGHLQLINCIKEKNIFAIL